jgi:hypothetical protein
MRSDFNKLLTERERLGHTMKFGDYRNAKLNTVLDEDMSGGKESMHARRRNAKGGNGGRKSFNENLNPLKNFLRVNAGRPWDKIYSEITQTFDKRKVVNNHILEHLFQYVELEVYIIDGKPHTLNKWRGHNHAEPYSLIETNPRYPTYYVDPRDGLMKVPKMGRTRKQRDRDQLAERIADQAKAYRRLDDDNHLILQDGIWWHYVAKNKPAQIAEYRQTPEWTLAQNIQSSYMLSCAWSALPQELKEKHGKKVMVDAPMPDKIATPDVIGFSSHNYYYRQPSSKMLIPDTTYFCSKTAASHKMLKQAGVAGMVPEGEVKTMSHREASKYRPKKAGK